MAAWGVRPSPPLLAGFLEHTAAAFGTMGPDRMIALVTGVAQVSRSHVHPLCRLLRAY